MEVVFASILCLVVFIFIIIAVNTNSSSSKSDFSIEHYPLTGRYYPKYKNYYYLEENLNTGIIEKKEPDYFFIADYGRTEQEARDILDLYREQQLKFNVKKIKL